MDGATKQISQKQARQALPMLSHQHYESSAPASRESLASALKSGPLAFRFSVKQFRLPVNRPLAAQLMLESQWGFGNQRTQRMFASACTADGTIQRQEIPVELMRSVDLTSLSVEELNKRYDLIVTTLTLFNQSTAETKLLEEETGRIGIELARRAALAAGRTFTPTAIERMRNYFIANATSVNPASCIDTLNAGVRLLLAEPAQPVAGEIQTTMARLQATGRAGPPQVIEFNDVRGNLTTGTRRPHTLSQSVWDTVIGMTGGNPGWSVFGLSIMDGYHSVILTLDNSNPLRPHAYWSDQWRIRGGWQEFDKAGLDAEITRLTQQWWDDKPQNQKPRTRVTLWRLQQ